MSIAPEVIRRKTMQIHVTSEHRLGVKAPAESMALIGHFPDTI